VYFQTSQFNYLAQLNLPESIILPMDFIYLTCR